MLAFTSRATTACISCPAAAATASLVAVCGLSVLLGLGFLPQEFKRQSHHVSISQHLAGDGEVSAVTHFWSIAESGIEGRGNHLLFQKPDNSSAELDSLWPYIEPQSIAAGPDARHVVVGTLEGELYLLDRERPEEVPQCIGRQGVRGVVAVACSADGQTVLSQSGNDLYAWDVASGDLRWRTDEIGQGVFAIHPSCRTAIVGCTSGALAELDLQTGDELRRLQGPGAAIVAATISGDGRRVAIIDAMGVLKVLDAESGEPQWADRMVTAYPLSFGRFAAFSTDAKQLVIASEDQGTTLLVRDAENGRRLQELRGHQKTVLGAAFGPRGELRSWGLDGTIRVWNVRTGTLVYVAYLKPPWHVG